MILSALGIRYLGDRSCHDIHVQRPQKPLSNELQLIMLQIPIKLKKTTIIRSTLDEWYPETVAVAIFVFRDPKNPRVTSCD